MDKEDIAKFEEEVNLIYQDIKALKFRAKTILIKITELEDDFK